MRTLEANPGISNADLFAGAREIDASVTELSGRQFHARYLLQVRARLQGPRRPSPRRRGNRRCQRPREPAAADAPAWEGDPVAVRRLLLDLAREPANAGSRADTSEVLARLDYVADYVAEIMKAAQG